MFRGLNESLKHWVEVQYLKRKPHAVSLRNLIKVQCSVIARAVTDCSVCKDCAEQLLLMFQRFQDFREKAYGFKQEINCMLVTFKKKSYLNIYYIF